MNSSKSVPFPRRKIKEVMELYGKVGKRSFTKKKFLAAYNLIYGLGEAAKVEPGFLDSDCYYAEAIACMNEYVDGMGDHWARHVPAHTERKRDIRRWVNDITWSDHEEYPFEQQYKLNEPGGARSKPEVILFRELKQGDYKQIVADQLDEYKGAEIYGD